MLDFYSKQARSKATEFREAACECISELAVKIDRTAVQPHLPAMLAVLIGCFLDSAWPVRQCINSHCVQQFVTY